jgi:fatty acid desaturase
MSPQECDKGTHKMPKESAECRQRLQSTDCRQIFQLAALVHYRSTGTVLVPVLVLVLLLAVLVLVLVPVTPQLLQ